MVLVTLAPARTRKRCCGGLCSEYLAADLRPGSCALGLSLILIKFLHGQESAKEAAKSFVTAIIAAGFRSNIVCCKLWRKRHASDGQSNSERCYRCWPRGHSCDVAIGNTDSQRLRLARLNPTRYRGTHSNGARRLQLAARKLVCESPHEQDDQHANRDVIGNYHGTSRPFDNYA